MREFKVDPKTGKILYKVQPEGLPALWVEDGLCDRCEPYKKCLGLSTLEEEQWRELKAILRIEDLNDELIKAVKEKYDVDLAPLVSEDVFICNGSH